MTTGWTEKERKSEGWFRKFMGGDGLELARATMEPVYNFIDENLDNPFFLYGMHLSFLTTRLMHLIDIMICIKMRI